MNEYMEKCLRAREFRADCIDLMRREKPRHWDEFAEEDWEEITKDYAETP